MPFNAEQYFTINPPAFLWKATFRMAPLLSVSGRDGYQSGEDSIEMRLLSLGPVGNTTGGGLNQGALLRLLRGDTVVSRSRARRLHHVAGD